MARTREFDEDEVLRAARDQFWSTGYAGTSVDAIAAATGLGKGSLYGAFEGKQALFRRVFDAYCDGIVDATRRHLRGPDDAARGRLEGYLRAIASSTAADERHRGCLLAKGAAELSEHDPAVAARARETVAALQQAIAGDVAAAQRYGDIDPDADPQALAGVLLAVVRGIEALGKADADAVTLNTIADTAISLLPERRAG